MNDLAYMKSIDGIDYLTYNPILLHLYDNVYSGEDIPPYFFRFIHRLRMTREFLFAKYQVVYLRKKGQFIGHLVVSRGGTRIAISTKEDIVIGPIWIIPSERSKGYGSMGIHAVLHELGFTYRYAYEYIKSDNIASIKAAEKNGFLCLGEFKQYGLLKTIKEKQNGDILVYRV